MGLPPVFKTKPPVTSLYITLLLSDSNIQAALWQRQEQEITLLNKSSVCQYAGSDQAVTQADKALQELGKQSEQVNDVVFALPLTWTDTQGVVDAKKPLLKAITEELNLKAVGFVMISEAITKQLIAQDPRLSTLLIEFSQYELFLTLISQGKFISTQYVGRSGDTMADMTEALARLNAHQEEEIKFPAQMKLVSLDLDEAELREQQQLLLAHDWVNSHPFTYPPTVDLLDQDMILTAVVDQSGGAQSKTVSASYRLPPTQDEIRKKTAKNPASETAIELDEDEKVGQKALSFGVPVSLSDLKQRNKPEIEASDEVDLSNPISYQQQTTIKTKMKFNRWFGEHRLFAVVGFVAGLLALSIITWFWLNSGVKAVVKLSLVTETVAKETAITLISEPESTPAGELNLMAQAIEKQISAKKTKEATGVKVVGDQATGEVTLYNKTDAVKSFEQGTRVSQGSLIFTLDEGVTVASASSKETSGGKEIEYGKSNVKVTAVEIGADSNLEKDIELQVASFDPGTYSAISATVFSGGSSREVRVVSARDQNQLVEELSKKLLADAKKEIQTSLKDGEYIASVSIDQVDQQLFDAKVGDEVSVVTLDLAVTVRALTYQTEDLKPLAQQVLAEEIPAGYTLADSEPQILSAPDQVASSSGEVHLLVNITAEAKPDLDLAELKKNILGKKLDIAQRLLTDREEVKSVEIDLVPNFVARIYARVPQDETKVVFQ